MSYCEVCQNLYKITAKLFSGATAIDARALANRLVGRAMRVVMLSHLANGLANQGTFLRPHHGNPRHNTDNDSWLADIYCKLQFSILLMKQGN